MRILIVEDDCLLAEAVSDYFSAKGWQTEEAHDGNSALEMAASGNWQMILLDVMLPGMDGFSVCREIRRSSDVPVFFITARVLEADELNGYAVGADDYVTKPFSLPVLYAKVMAMMGRIRGGRPEERVRRGDVEVDAGTRKVYVQGKERFLPPKEFEMLLFFLENPNRTFTREQLLIRFWGYDFDGNERVVDNHIKKLRKALAELKRRYKVVPDSTGAGGGGRRCEHWAGVGRKYDGLYPCRECGGRGTAVYALVRRRVG